jgi:hypothetical protein
MDAKPLIRLAVALAALAAFAGWRGARPPDPLRGPRLFPWRFVMLLAAAAAILTAGVAVGLLRQPG